MNNAVELPKQPQPEQKDQQILFELIEKMLKKKHQTVLADFKKKHQKILVWAQQNSLQLTNVRNTVVHFMVTGGASGILLANMVIPQAPPSPSAQVLPLDNAIQSSMTSGVASPTATSHPVQPTPRPTNGTPVTPVPTQASTPVPTTTPVLAVATPQPGPTQPAILHSEDPVSTIKEKLAQYKSWPSEQGENEISAAISQFTGVPAKATLEGHKMNKIVGLMGGEQHLYRYPGDSLAEHAKNEADKQMFLPAGIAPGLGSWGYFASSKASFTAQDEARERYYIAAQTFLFPGFYSDKGFKDWLRYRKVLVYNPNTGKAVVADIGDAGPATWTGKTYGGSPEVMHFVDLAVGPRKGEVVVLFVDDPNDAIPLGPINIGK